jgi:hypothetical protein
MMRSGLWRDKKHASCSGGVARNIAGKDERCVLFACFVLTLDEHRSRGSSLRPNVGADLTGRCTPMSPNRGRYGSPSEAL